jgi:hypothetical protein
VDATAAIVEVDGKVEVAAIVPAAIVSAAETVSAGAVVERAKVAVGFGSDCRQPAANKIKSKT